MSSQPPHQSPLERAKAEMNTLTQDFQKDLDNLRIAPLMEYETRITSLANTFQASQELATKKVESAFDVSDQRTRGFENNLRAQKALLQNAHQRLRAEKALADRLGTELSAEKEAAKNRDEELKAELATARGEREEARSELQKVRTELEQARRGPPDLQQELEAVKKRNVDFQKEAAVGEQYRSDLLKHLTSARSYATQLEAKLQTATTRARASEDGLNASQSSFNRFKEGLDALVDSYKEELTQTRPNSASSQHIDPQDSAAECNHGPQTRSHQVQTQATDPNLANSTSNNEADLLLCQNVLEEVMHQKHWPYNRHFLKPADPVAPGLPMHLKATTQPMGLSAMKEKLAKGGYTSANSFKEDFYFVIANSSKGRPLSNHVPTAGRRLLDIFDEQWSAARLSSPSARGHTIQDHPSRGHKRKASTERPALSEGTDAAKRAHSLPLLNNHATRPSRHCSGERLPIRQDQSQRASGTSAGSEGAAGRLWEGQITTGPNIQVDAKVDVIITRACFVKPVNTFHSSCKELFPDKLEVQGHVAEGWLEDEIQKVECDHDRDMIAFLIRPALETDTTKFTSLVKSFDTHKRAGTVKHAGGYHASEAYLIPVSNEYHFAWSISGQKKDRYSDTDEDDDSSKFSPIKTSLMLVVVFRVTEAAQEQIRLAWDAAIKAVRSPNMNDLAGVGKHLRHHPLPIFRPFEYVVSGHERHMLSYQISRDRSSAEPNPYPEGFFRLFWGTDQSGQPSIDGVKLPSWVFPLGRVINPTAPWTLLIVDVEHEDRPLWGITRSKTTFWLSNEITLVSSKFPSSWEEWESTMTMDHYKNQLKKCIHLPCLGLGRYDSGRRGREHEAHE